jgi:hypothetical protein
MRAFLFLGALSLVVAASAAERGRSVTGPAPVGATGPAPIGATGPAPIGAVRSLLSTSGPGRSWSSYHGGGFTLPYPNGFTSPRSYPNRNLDHRYGHRDRNFGVAAPLFYGVGYLPSDTGYYDDSMPASPYASSETAVDPMAQQLDVEQNVLAGEIQRLNQEIQDLKEEVRPVSQLRPETREPAPSAQQIPPGSANQTAPPVTVVLRNGNRFKSNDYAVMNDTFWDLSKSPARRVAMSDVNIPESVRASASDGAQFPE